MLPKMMLVVEEHTSWYKADGIDFLGSISKTLINATGAIVCWQVTGTSLKIGLILPRLRNSGSTAVFNVLIYISKRGSAMTDAISWIGLEWIQADSKDLHALILVSSLSISLWFTRRTLKLDWSNNKFRFFACVPSATMITDWAEDAKVLTLLYTTLH